MRTCSARWLAVVSGLSLATVPAAAQGVRSPTAELGGGVFTAHKDLGHAYPLTPDGHLRLGRLRAGAAADVGVLLETPLFGLRPLLRLAYAPSRAVPASWRPCEPWAACPAILIQPETRVSRVHLMAGVELPLVRFARGGDLHATFAAGGRRYGISWEEWGGPPEDSFHLPEGADGMWDPLLQTGVGIAVEVGVYAVVMQWSVSWSDFGPGVRSGPDGSGGIATVDLGRRRMAQHAVRVGVRRALSE
jgi:hypothetical protein